MNHTPKLCHHKAAQQGYVTLNGKEHYLGHWSRDQRKVPPAVRAEYDVIIARWLANGRKLPTENTTPVQTVTVNKIILEFVGHAERHHTQQEVGTNAEVDGIKSACRVLSKMFGPIPAVEFGPKALKAVRSRMLELGWSRTYCNHQVNRLKRMFRWAVAEELCPATVIHALSAVPAIRKGQPGVRETEPVKPVPEEWIEAALPFMTPQVATMVRLQWISGARPGEIIRTRGREIDRIGTVWVYKPERHKNTHRGHGRDVYFGPRAQAILSPWLKEDADVYLFRPIDAVKKKRKRKTKAKRKPQEKYSVHSYRRAIARACRRADRQMRREAVKNARKENPAADVAAIEASVYCPPWSPGRLRHNAATAMRKEFGVEMARLALGHKHGFTTEIYAERDLVKILAAVERIG